MGGAVLVKTAQLSTDDDGFSTLAGVTTGLQPKWTYAPSAGASATSTDADTSAVDRLSFAADQEADINDDGAFTWASYADRVLIGKTMYNLETGTPMARYQSAPIAIANDCRALEDNYGRLSLVSPTGTELWSADGSDLGAPRDTYASFIGTAGDVVAVGGGGSEVRAFSATSGRELWDIPALDQDNKFLDAFGLLTVRPGQGMDIYDAHTGRTRYADAGHERLGLSLSPATPVAFGCSNNVGNGYGTCRVVDLTADKTITTLTDVAGVWPVQGGYLVATRKDVLSFYDRPSDTRPTWTAQGPVGLLPDASNERGSWPATEGDLLLPFDNGSTRGAVWSIALKDGSVTWQRPVSDTHSGTQVGVWVDTQANVALVYPQGYVNTAGGSEALDLTTGRVVWSSPDVVVGFHSDVILVHDGPRVTALDTNTGRPLWSAALPQ